MDDFLLVLIELFFRQLSQLRCCELILVEIVVIKGGGSLSARISGGRSPTTAGVRKLQSLGYHIALFA